MKYNPDIHHRRSIRLRGYDYSREGAYFVTICVHRRRCIFGHIENGKMLLNEMGETAYQEWEKLPNRWPHIELGAFQVMPNHVHGVIIIHDVAVGAPLAGAPATPHDNAGAPATSHDNAGAPATPHDNAGAPDNAGAQLIENAVDKLIDGVGDTRAPARGAPTRTTQIQWAKKPTLGQIVGAYKSCTLTGCLKITQSRQPEIWLGKLWQRNFWEIIIRDLAAFDQISRYIINNPVNWESDKFYCAE